MFSAVEEHTLHFRFVHEPDGSPIGYEKVCKAEGRPVPDSEIVKAFEVEKGEFVYMADEDFETAEAEAQGGRTIDIRTFVPYEEIDPIYFERTYYLGPQEGGERVYTLLARAMEETGSRRSPSSSCATRTTSPACASARASSRSSGCTSRTRFAPPASSLPTA
jgi:DNA end-binding protein Ku